MAWLARKTLAEHSHLPPSPAPRQGKGVWAEHRDTLSWLAVLAVMAVAAAWLQRHPGC